MLYCSAAGKDWALDTDFEAAGQQIQRGYLSMLAIDSLLAFMGSVEKLTDFAVDQSGDVPAALSKGPGSGEHRAGWDAVFGVQLSCSLRMVPPTVIVL